MQRRKGRANNMSRSVEYLWTWFIVFSVMLTTPSSKYRSNIRNVHWTFQRRGRRVWTTRCTKCYDASLQPVNSLMWLLLQLTHDVKHQFQLFRATLHESSAREGGCRAEAGEPALRHETCALLNRFNLSKSPQATASKYTLKNRSSITQCREGVLVLRGNLHGQALEFCGSSRAVKRGL